MFPSHDRPSKFPASTGDGLIIAYFNTYSANNDGADATNTIHAESENGGSSSSHVLFSNVLAGGGATTVMNQIQGANLGADTYNGTLQ